MSATTKATTPRLLAMLLSVALAAPAGADPKPPPKAATKQKPCPAEHRRDEGGHCVGVFACPDGMIAIPSTTFSMGRKGAKDDQGPAHPVTLSAFCIDRTEVRARAWRECVAAGVCTAPTYDQALCNALHEDRGEHPANCVTWEGADAFCRWAKKRLPTEAEWELAARGTDGRTFPWGAAGPGKTRVQASTEGRWLTETVPVESFPDGASPYGALQMSGNVCELVSDYHAPRYPDGAQRDPRGPEKGKLHVCRGGSLNNRDGPALSTTFRRRGYQPGSTDELSGLRCAADPQP